MSTSTAALIVSIVAAAVSVLAVIYTARNAIANQRRLRNEADAPRRTRFTLTLESPMLVGSDLVGAWTVQAANIGGADATRVAVSVSDRRSPAKWRAELDLFPHDKGDPLVVEMIDDDGKRLQAFDVDAEVRWSEPDRPVPVWWPQRRYRRRLRV